VARPMPEPPPVTMTRSNSSGVDHAGFVMEFPPNSLLTALSRPARRMRSRGL
jgi:hypothetical protein